MKKIDLGREIYDEFEDIKLGLGISTYERPDGLNQALSTAVEAIECGSPPYDIFVADDGSKNADQLAILDSIERGEYGKNVSYNKEDRIRVGVGNNKNRIIENLFDKGCNYIVILEDDAYVKDPRWYVLHVKAAQNSSVHHFNFVPHSMPNHVGQTYAVSIEKRVLEKGNINNIRIVQTQHITGIFLFFTRQCISRIGGFDQRFGLYGFEHVELSDRIRHPRIGLTPPGAGYSSINVCEQLIGWDMEFPPIITEEEKPELIDQQRALWDSMRKDYGTGFMFRDFRTEKRKEVVGK